MGISRPPYRLWISILVFFIAYITFSMQVSFLSSITANGIITNTSEKSSYVRNSNAMWPPEMTSLVIDSYFWGYILANAPAGLISDWYGPYNIIMYSLILMVFMNSLCVRALEWHYAAVIVCRILLGALSGAILPSLQTLISNWSPPGEKGKFTSALLGSSFGLLVSWFFTGTISSKFGMDWGFHNWSIQAALICLIFGLVASNRPQDHTMVTFEEKKFIKESQRPLNSNLRVFPPYLKMATSKPFWALCIGHFGSVWTLRCKLLLMESLILFHNGIDNNIPSTDGITYLIAPTNRNPNKVLFVMVLVYISLIFEVILGFLSGYVDDILKVKMPSKRTLTRRCFIIWSHLTPGFLLLLSLIPEITRNQPGYIVVAISFILTGTSVGFNFQNIHDLAPNFAGSVYGLLNAVGGISFLILPSVHTDGQEAFFVSGKVELVTGIILVVTGIFSAIFVSGQTQEWNYKVGQRTDEEVPIRGENGRSETNGVSRLDE